MAIEDGVILTTILSADISTDEVPNRLKLYEEIRKQRVGRVRETARTIINGLENRHILEEYHSFLKSMVRWNMPRKPRRNPWAREVKI